MAIQRSAVCLLIVSLCVSSPAWAQARLSDAPVRSTPHVLLAKANVTPAAAPPLVHAETSAPSMVRFALLRPLLAAGVTAALIGLIVLAVGVGDLSAPNYSYTTYNPYYGYQYTNGNPNYGTGVVLAVLGLIHLAAGGTCAALGGVQLASTIRAQNGSGAALQTTGGGTAFTF